MLVLCAIVLLCYHALSILVVFTGRLFDNIKRWESFVSYICVLGLPTSYIHGAYPGGLAGSVVMLRECVLLTFSPIGVRHAEVVILRQPSNTFPKRRVQRLS